ncbi:phage tail protein [Escherichia coli]|uniref:phage tail protein n=1 Tax=Escherichia coli TaxID=562 RepID=UPI001CDD9010|nr:phage tail protein [Escherichia coli]
MAGTGVAVDFWQDDWSEEQKRQILRDAAYVHQHRGRRVRCCGAWCGWCSGSNQRVAGFTAQNRTPFVWSCFAGRR